MINIPQIKETIHLSDYAPEFGPDAVIQVWLNPPQRIWGELYAAFASSQQQVNLETAPVIAGSLAQIWGVQPDEVIKLIAESIDTDPMLPVWLITKTVTMLQDHRTRIKKNWMMRS